MMDRPSFTTMRTQIEDGEASFPEKCGLENYFRESFIELIQAENVI